MPPLPYDKLLNSSKHFLHSFFDFFEVVAKGSGVGEVGVFRGPLNSVLAVLGGGASGPGLGRQGGEGEVEVEIVGSEPEECEDGWHEELERADTFGVGHHHDHGHGFGVVPAGGGGGISGMRGGIRALELAMLLWFLVP
ncbi:hypothetical protein JAAARDRAFT_220996 [Jaapia argillacea MUCL 33604]|uniref:Uncharacterized protein n=1 Tax=Jaapia argillacea MUCL 33604 TaxID=933084 RepID=A0A067QDM4_9AGAM|nr:hypothetical protein JAAARDRAFT_220996 [Jaapia argillacea MUCL 33604]